MPLGRICRQAGGVICTSCPRSCRLDNARRSAKSSANGLTLAAWKRQLRAAVLERDEHRCRLQLPGCNRRANTVHLRAELGGDHRRATIDDCLSACLHCHGIIDAPRARRQAKP